MLGSRGGDQRSMAKLRPGDEARALDRAWMTSGSSPGAQGLRRSERRLNADLMRAAAEAAIPVLVADTDDGPAEGTDVHRQTLSQRVPRQAVGELEGLLLVESHYFASLLVRGRPLGRTAPGLLYAKHT